jgi:hypothetical protein
VPCLGRAKTPCFRAGRRAAGHLAIYAVWSALFSREIAVGSRRRLLDLGARGVRRQKRPVTSAAHNDGIVRPGREIDRRKFTLVFRNTHALRCTSTENIRPPPAAIKQGTLDDILV